MPRNTLVICRVEKSQLNKYRNVFVFNTICKSLTKLKNAPSSHRNKPNIILQNVCGDRGRQVPVFREERFDVIIMLAARATSHLPYSEIPPIPSTPEGKKEERTTPKWPWSRRRLTSFLSAPLVPALSRIRKSSTCCAPAAPRIQMSCWLLILWWWKRVPKPTSKRPGYVLQSQLVSLYRPTARNGNCRQ